MTRLEATAPPVMRPATTNRPSLVDSSLTNTARKPTESYHHTSVRRSAAIPPTTTTPSMTSSVVPNGPRRRRPVARGGRPDPSSDPSGRAEPSPGPAGPSNHSERLTALLVPPSGEPPCRPWRAMYPGDLRTHRAPWSGDRRPPARDRPTHPRSPRHRSARRPLRVGPAGAAVRPGADPGPDRPRTPPRRRDGHPRRRRGGVERRRAGGAPGRLGPGGPARPDRLARPGGGVRPRGRADRRAPGGRARAARGRRRSPPRGRRAPGPGRRAAARGGDPRRVGALPAAPARPRQRRPGGPRRGHRARAGARPAGDLQ